MHNGAGAILKLHLHSLIQVPNNSSISMISLEFDISNLLFLASDSNIAKSATLNSSQTLSSCLDSQFSNRYANKWIKFCLQILDLKLDEEIISLILIMYISPPLRFSNWPLFLDLTFERPIDLKLSSFNCPFIKRVNDSLVVESIYGIY